MKKLREGVYLTGLAMESLNRAAKIINKPEPIKPRLIYAIYRLGKALK